MTRFTWNVRRLRGTLLLGIALAAAGGTSVRPALAQQAGEGQPAQNEQPSAESADDERDREIRRLPTFYSQVVAPYQRERIYQVQAKYEEQIQALQQQIKALLAQRDAEIEMILLPEQREVLKKIRAEAEARRAKEQAERRKAEATENAPAENGAPTPETPAPTGN